MFTSEQKAVFQGLGALVITPFKEDLSVDYDAIGFNMRDMQAKGLNPNNGFFVAGGTMGECGSMSLDERKKVICKVCESAGDMAVVAGINDNSVINIVELADVAKKAGASAMLLTPPYYIPYDDEQIFQFYKYVNDHTELPIMIYNNPAVAGRDLSTKMLRRLSELDHIFAVKQATSSIMTFVHTGMLKEKLLIFTASSSHMPMGSVLGANGFISFISSVNTPLQVNLWEAVKAKDWELACKYHEEEMILYDYWWSGGMKQNAGTIVHMKKMMSMIGRKGGHVRPPLIDNISLEEENELKKILYKWNLLEEER